MGLQELGAESKGLRVVMGEGYKANESKSFQKPSSVNNERISYMVILESSTNTYLLHIIRSDWKLICLYNVIPKSKIDVTRIEEMITI